MAKPTSKATLKEYCLRKLGKPVLEVNVSDDQIDDAIDYTLQKFNEFHFDGVERVYLKHQFTQAEIDAAKSNTTVGTVGGFTYSEMQNYLIVPDWVISVDNIFGFTDKGTANMFDIRYQIRLNDLYDFTSTQFYHYYMIQQHLSMIDFMLEHFKPIRYNRAGNRLYIDMDWGADVHDGDYMVFECLRATDPTAYTKIYNELWVKDYATAQIKKYWGTNLTKYQNVQLPGGITMNGDAIYNNAIEELGKLDDQLRSTYELPPLDMIG
jgi:hypothetical protein